MTLRRRRRLFEGASRRESRPREVDLTMNVTEVTEVTDDVVRAFERLIPQLNVSIAPPSKEELAEIVRSPATILFMAHDAQSKSVGTVTLVVFRIPAGFRARIEDLVVDADARRKGIGEALCRAAIRQAKEMDATAVDLTSHPARDAANRLYARLGFMKRETNVFQLAL